MSYIGAQPTTASFPFDQFSGNGSTTAFTLTYAPASTTSIIVAVSGVVQNPNTYSCIGTTLTFTGAPPTGTNNISVLYLGLPVQIGTPIPGSTLQLALGSAANPSLTFLGDTNTGIYSPGTDTIAFVEGGVEAMRIDTSGQLGVGFTPLSTQGNLQVYKSISGGAPATTGSTDANQVFAINEASVQTSFGAYANGTAWIQQRAGGNFAVNYDLVLQPNGGNVGIGTSSPSSRFDVRTSAAEIARFSSSATNGGYQIFYPDNVTTPVYVGSQKAILSTGNATDFAIVGTGANNIVFGTNSTERARIDSSGNLLLNTTDDNSGTFKFKVQTSSGYCLGLRTSSSPGVSAVTMDFINDGNTANVPWDIRASAIYASSGIGTTASAANAYFNSGASNQFLRSTSALKYKTNIRDLESIDISQFRPVRYNSLCEADDPSREHFGLIADEVDAAGIEELVTYGENGDVEGFQYERLTVVLLKAMQEQQAMIETLQAKVAALEAK